MTETNYIGRELDLFLQAKRWKKYWSSFVRPWLFGDVLEVGAGIGANTPWLYQPEMTSWTCLEPDPDLAQRAQGLFAGDPALSRCQIVLGTTSTLTPGLRFDVLLYIDVLEHIEHDREELERSATLLREGGRLIVLSPAHQELYSEFDRSLGHFRRYDQNTLRACGPANCTTRKLLYLDSCGLLASSANRILLHQSMPTLRQILFWDHYVIPASQIVDKLFLHRLGKSILAVWTKNSVDGDTK